MLRQFQHVYASLNTRDRHEPKRLVEHALPGRADANSQDSKSLSGLGNNPLKKCSGDTAAAMPLRHIQPSDTPALVSIRERIDIETANADNLPVEARDEKRLTTLIKPVFSRPPLTEEALNVLISATYALPHQLIEFRTEQACNLFYRQFQRAITLHIFYPVALARSAEWLRERRAELDDRLQVPIVPEWRSLHRRETSHPVRRARR